MPQTRRRRKTKHRGNAVGMIEARGRTGRKPTTAEKSRATRASSAKPTRADRLDRPPTWKGAVLRSMAAAVVMLLFAMLLIKKPAQAIALFPIVLVLYIPLSYYTDSWLYKRRQRQKLAKQAAEKAASASDKGSAR